MRDGVELAVRIIRPDAEGQFPALMAYNAYRILTTLKQAASEREYSNGTNAPHYFAQRGYISVYYDVRGTGGSGGSNSGMYSDEERQDGYDMVEWIAAQSWSNGSVGIWGKSYGAVAALQVAALAPPHLKAIIVRSGTDDLYRDWAYPGGSLRSLFMFGGYTAVMTAFNFAPPDPKSGGEKWAAIWEEHLQNSVPWSIPFLEHPTEDEYWQARSVHPDYDRIQCAVFMIEGWADWYQTAELRTFANLKVPKRALVGPWAHYWPEDAFPGPRFDARPEYLKWFDQFLKGIDTGVLEEPPVTIFVRQYQPPAPMVKEEPGFWRHENEWPPARTRYTPMYLGSLGHLQWQADDREQPERDSYPYRASVGVTNGILGQGLIPPWAMPLDQRQDEVYSLTYTTAPLETELEVTGTPTVALFVSSSADVAYFVVKVCDVAPDGTSKLISEGGLNATHRVSDSHPEPLKPDEVYELKFGLKSMAYIFVAGHRIRVDISSADFLNAWPVSKAAVNTVLRGAQCPSRVILPIVPPQMPLLLTPQLEPSAVPFPDTLAKPEYNITYDLINQTTTVSLVQIPIFSAAPSISRTTYTVSDLNPADAVINCTVDYFVPGAEEEVKVCVHMVTASDANVFRHMVEVEVTVEGETHFTKSWTVSAPRILN
jgi:hypothetical protein